MTMLDIVRHYDLLIDEGNDPVHDPAPLWAYMDQWDGDAFLRLLKLDGSQSVLEIGVGTGRLALRIAPGCRHFTGIDLSPKTVARAEENLQHLPNVTLLRGDFHTAEFATAFDVICSSLTFMHMADKAAAVSKIVALLAPRGRVVLSLDKNQDGYIDYGTRRIRVYPDDAAQMAQLLAEAGLTLCETLETEFAWIIAAERR